MNGRLIRAHALLALAALLTVATPVLAGYVVDGVIFHNNAGGIGDGSYYDAGTQTRVSVFTHNDLEVDPMLLNPYGNPYGLIGQPNNKNPQFIPRDGSPALGWVDDVVNIVHNAAECSQDGCRPNLQTVCYRGAIPPVSQGYDWTVGWIYNNLDGAGRTDINYGKPVFNVSGDIPTTIVKTAPAVNANAVLSAETAAAAPDARRSAPVWQQWVNFFAADTTPRY